jgi:hypothetical protein
MHLHIYASQISSNVHPNNERRRLQCFYTKMASTAAVLFITIIIIIIIIFTNTMVVVIKIMFLMSTIITITGASIWSLCVLSQHLVAYTTRDTYNLQTSVYTSMHMLRKAHVYMVHTPTYHIHPHALSRPHTLTVRHYRRQVSWIKTRRVLSRAGCWAIGRGSLPGHGLRRGPSAESMNRWI